MLGGMSMDGMPAQTQFDATIESKLDQWVYAKRQQDFATADAIRAQLRQIGIEPDQVRPNDKGGQASGLTSSTMTEASFTALPSPQLQASLATIHTSSSFDPATDEKLDQWVAAKREKNFALADSIRAELRAIGVDPDTVRPSDKTKMAQVPSDPYVEAKLDQWVTFKREKKFDEADAIRAELRGIGIEPEILRPADFAGKHAQATQAQNDAWAQAASLMTGMAAGAFRSPMLTAPAPKIKSGAMSFAGQGALGAGFFTPDIEAKLDRWVKAKRDKDFIVADALRLDLRSSGIDPDTVRPPDYTKPAGAQAAMIPGLQGAMVPGLQAPRAQVQAQVPGSMAAQIASQLSDFGLGQAASGASGGYDADTQAKLDQWVLAKRAKDFATADFIREELRGIGIDPDHVRPSDKAFGRQGAPALNPATEAKLDQWVRAKRDKDFATADAIRAELRTMGLEPDQLRPAGPDQKRARLL
eukprot:TRINITY_DN29981_c0_g2_i1.p1 TRINITY_DN29981_c0_g2~~TRINITY_DN29981_c0_g2_i1.p1  ORF type:complete len:472 (+),score=105.63 TRINITY_DN29981_c0_g2_i1:41-1456(+)